MTRRVMLVAVLVVACTQGGGLPRAGDVVIAGATWRIAPAAATSAAGYLDVRHLGTIADTLVAVHSDAGAVSIHTSSAANGLMMMRPLDLLEILPGRTTRLRAGEHHLMLEQFTRPLAVGDTVQLTLQLARGGAVTVAMPVRMVGDD
jgi:copper(I)-binding protein